MEDSTRNYLMHQLRRNDPEDVKIYIKLTNGDLRNDNQIAAVAHALHGHEYANDLTFFFADRDNYDNDEDQQDLSLLNWGPLLRELETREKLETVTILDSPTRDYLITLFRDQFWQALQRNTNVKSLELVGIEFSGNNVAAIVSFLDGASALTDLLLESCTVDSRDVARNIATALQRNNRIQTLKLGMWDDEEYSLCRTFLHSLASSDIASRLKKLTFQLPDVESEQELESIAENLGQYLESTHVLQCLELEYVRFDQPSVASHILRGLSRNQSVTELAFCYCSIAEEEEDFDDDDDDEDDDEQDPVQELATFFQSMTALKSLRITDGDFFNFESVCAAVAEGLVRCNSTLRCLDFEVGRMYWPEVPIPLPGFQSLLVAASRNFKLQRLRIGCPPIPDDPHVNAILEAVPSLKATDLALVFRMQPRPDHKEGLLRALENNYIFQSIDCGVFLPSSREDLFDEADRAQLEIYLNRNRRLAEWVKNPKLVPQELWSYALDLALKAGINPLFQSLLALSGEGVGLRMHRRKGARETDTLSIEINERIKDEYRKGFWILDHSAGQLSRQSQRELLQKDLGYRRHWLRSIVAARKHAEDRQQQGQPPREILEGIGLVEWKRHQTGRGNQ